jgi:hypothetical protein
MVDQLEEMSDDEVPTKDFLSFCSDVLKDPRFQGSNMYSYVNLMQQAKFAIDFFEKVEEIEDFTEATLADLLKEIPDNSKNLVERIARPYFKMQNLSTAAMQAFSSENEEEDLEISAVSAAPVASSSNSTPAPAVPDLELEAREFHMGKSTPYPTTGFSAPEGTHRWTEGKEATISFTDMTPRPSRVSFLNTGGFTTASHPQNLTVKVNGKEVKSYVYTPSNNNQTIDIDLPKTGPAIIEFEIPTAISPFKLVGTNPDKRELGILFKEIHFQY